MDQVHIGPSHEVQIAVGDPQQRDSKVQKYTVYTVKGADSTGNFWVYRRYSEFLLLRQRLVQSWPGVFVPSLPHKKAIGNLDSVFVERRRQALDGFANKLAKVPALFYSSEFRLFLKDGPENFKVTISRMPPQTYSEIIQKYEKAFPHLAGQEINTQLEVSINIFNSFARKLRPVLANWLDIAQNTQKSRAKLKKELTLFSSYLLPTYESTCLHEYSNGKSVLPTTQLPPEEMNELTISLQPETTNGYDHLVTHLEQQLLDLDAIMDALEQKQKMESLKDKLQNQQRDLQLELSRLLAGKTSLINMFRRQDKEVLAEQVESKIAKTEKDFEQVQFITEVVAVILGHFEIPAFKREHAQMYLSAVQTASQQETIHEQTLFRFWSALRQHLP